MKKVIDINCDMGECNNEDQFVREIELMPFISSANISCGFHSGNSEFIRRVVSEAIEHRVVIGAHPSYPDKVGFGRRPMKFSKTELRELLRLQLEFLSEILSPFEKKIPYLKPHGALYHSVMSGGSDAEAVLEAVQEHHSEMSVVGLPGTMFEEMANREGIRFLREGFADRKYQSDGTLVSRKNPDAVLTDPEDAVIQTMLMVTQDKVRAEGSIISMKVDSICLHSDNPSAIDIGSALRQALSENSILVRSVFQ